MLTGKTGTYSVAAKKIGKTAKKKKAKKKTGKRDLGVYDELN